MNIGWLKGLLQTGQRTMVKHAPEILMALGTAEVGGSVILAIKAGPKAVYLLEDAGRKKAEQERKELTASGKYQEGQRFPLMSPLTWREKVKAVYRVYIPPIGLAVLGIGCFWGAQGINMHRQAILAGLYSTAEASLQEYQRKVVDMMGRETHNEIKNAIAEDKTKQITTPGEASSMPGAGITDVWYRIDGKLFPSNYVKVKEVENEFNHRLLSEMYLTKAELWWMLDPSGQWLKPDSEEFNLEWSVDRMLVLRITDPLGPIAQISYEDKDGLEYRPVPAILHNH